MSAHGGLRVAALVLAAGRSIRLGRNKLIEPVGGTPMVRRVAEAALAAGADPVIAVTGHEAESVEHELAGRPVMFVRNRDFAAGLSTSLMAGVAALPPEADGVLVCLGDMPAVTAVHLEALIAGFAEPTDICVPVHGGRRGNPVLWGRHYFGEMMQLTGDTGAKRLMDTHADAVIEIGIESNAIFADVDTTEDLARMRAK